MTGTDIGLKGILAHILRNDLAGSCGRRVVVEMSVKESSVESVELDTGIMLTQ